MTRKQVNKNLKNTQNPSCEHLFFQFMTALSYIYSSQIAILEQQGKKNPTRSAYVYMQDLLFQVD